MRYRLGKTEWHLGNDNKYYMYSPCDKVYAARMTKQELEFFGAEPVEETEEIEELQFPTFEKREQLMEFQVTILKKLNELVRGYNKLLKESDVR